VVVGSFAKAGVQEIKAEQQTQQQSRTSSTAEAATPEDAPRLIHMGVFHDAVALID
jgi:hypothetical protein